MSSRICIKVSNLRKINGSNTTLESWLNDQNNVYCGRSGRIFITENGEKRYFSYKGSKWANPYTLKQHPIDECLDLYRKYITEKIEKDPNYNLDELRSKKLGCWCNPKDKCHVDVLLELLSDSDND